MKRAGFTMIELIFVIVILGILAAVAIPKLAATRDDASIAKGTSDMATLVGDLGAYYTARGGFNYDVGGVALMTNVPVGVTQAADGTAFFYEVPVGTNCVSVTISDANGTAAIAGTGAAVNTACDGVVARITANGLVKTHTFGGTSVQ